MKHAWYEPESCGTERDREGGKNKYAATVIIYVGPIWQHKCFY